ncbi:hypothetical protein Y032_0805g2438 [Ancylostoma ceylanicum]|uniref:Uncharacterized protein n=1 Tax=Ancylostoma ceylanicum TaxID=53326 RepID=A0A016WBT1_9BILA|nr:hypothetical protein Y032_0805g2438 [Ancylostoma ceylanicum]
MLSSLDKTYCPSDSSLWFVRLRRWLPFLPSSPADLKKLVYVLVATALGSFPVLLNSTDMLLLLSLLSYVDPLNAINACLLDGLNPGRQIVCDQIFSFNQVSLQYNVPNLVSTALPFPIDGPGITMADAISGALPSDRNQCLSIECACGFIQGANYDGSRCNLPDGSVMGQVQRREFRTLSPAERAL